MGIGYFKEKRIPVNSNFGANFRRRIHEVTSHIDGSSARPLPNKQCKCTLAGLMRMGILNIGDVEAVQTHVPHRIWIPRKVKGRTEQAVNIVAYLSCGAPSYLH